MAHLFVSLSVVLFLVVGTFAQAPAESASSPQDTPTGGGQKSSGNQSPSSPSQPTPTPDLGIAATPPPAPFIQGATAASFAAQGFFPARPSCADNYAKCYYWSSVGQCQSNQAWMFQECLAACTECLNPMVQLTCQDDNSACLSWISLGECTKHPAFMLYKCPRGCGYCSSDGYNSYPQALIAIDSRSNPKPNPNPPRLNSHKTGNCVGKPYACIPGPNGPCTDDHHLCAFWASPGQNQCEINPFYMTPTCTVSCNKC